MRCRLSVSLIILGMVCSSHMFIEGAEAANVYTAPINKVDTGGAQHPDFSGYVKQFPHGKACQVTCLTGL